MKFFMLFTLLVTQIIANDASYNRGEMLYFSKACSSCHGPSAEGSSQYPSLANKKKNYLIKKLKYFRKGKVSSISQEMMSQFAKKLSDKNIEDLVNFFVNHVEVKFEDIDDDILGGVGS